MPNPPVSLTSAAGQLLTAAGIASGAILRSGPTANYSDTLDSAANIIAALPGIGVGQGILFTLTNLTNYVETILAGTGVSFQMTSPQTATTQAANVTLWRVVATNVTSGSQAVTFYRLGSLGI